MNQAVGLCLLSIVTTKSQIPLLSPQIIPAQFSPFLSYLHPQSYAQYPSSQLQNPQLPYIVPAHTSLIQSPLKTLSIFPNLYRDSRALCSFCSCATDYGCAYNCHKCPALCYTCDCSSSLGCRYNCDKCQETAGGEIQETKPPTIPSTGLISVKIPAGCEGLQAEAELCTWGQICETIKNAQFPNCGYDCSTCKFASNTVNDKVEEGDEKTPSKEGENKFPESCSILENELRLCSWGPSCPTILDAQYPECNYNCETCTLEATPQVSPVEFEADDNWGNTQQTGNDISDFVSDVGGLNVWKPPPKPEAVEAEDDTEDIPEECLQLENEIDLCSWGPSCELVKDTQFPQCNYNCATCKLESSGSSQEGDHNDLDEADDSGENAEEQSAPQTAASTASQELISLWEQFKPNSDCGSFICDIEQSNWGQNLPIEAILADPEDSAEEKESDEDFSWTDFDSGSVTCVAAAGPGVGKECKFPFIHDGVKYDSCALLIENNGEESSGGPIIGWCSTKVDINRYHIAGPSYDKWHNVGFCGKSCFPE